MRGKKAIKKTKSKIFDRFINLWAVKLLPSILLAGILVWPFGQLLQLTPPGQTIRLQTLDLLAAALFLLLLPRYKKIISDPLFKPLAIFSALCAASLFIAAINGAVGPAALLYLIRFVAYTSFYFAFRLRGVKTYYLVLWAAVFVILGLAQYLFLPDMRILKYLGFDDHYFRLIGTFFDPNYSGLVLAVFTIMSMTIKKRRFIFLLPLTTLVLTFSRASYLSLAAGIIYLIFSQKKFKLLFSLIILALLLYLAPKPFGEGVNLLRTFSIQSRWQNQVQAINLFAKNPFFGVGFNTLKNSSIALVPNLTSGVDNSFLFVLTTTGIAGFAAFLYLIKVAWQLTQNPTARAALIAILVHSLFNNSLFFSWNLVLIFLLLNYPKESA